MASSDKPEDVAHVEVENGQAGLPDRPPAGALEANQENDAVGRDFTQTDDALPPGYFRSFHFLGSFVGIGMAFGCGVAGYSLIAPVLGVVNADLGPDANVAWVALAYLLTTSIGMMLVGRVTDIFGRRWWFVGGNAVGTLGAVVCAVAPSVPALIAGETLIGIGGSVQLSYSFAISEIVPLRWRFLAQAYVFVWGIPFSGMAAAVSYAFIYQTRAGWRGIFYLLVALNATTTLVFFFCYHPPSFRQKHGAARRKDFVLHFDYLGTLLVTLGLLLFLMGLSWGGTLHPWRSAAVVATVVVGFLVLVAFVVWERAGRLREPLLPLHVFRNRGYVVTILLWALGAAVYYANQILWPSMVRALYASGHGAMWTGYMACLPSCGILLGEYCGAWCTRRTDWQVRVTFSLGAVFMGAMATSTPTSLVRSAVLIFLASFCIGWSELMNSTVATISIDDQREIGTYTGTGGATRSLVSTVCSVVFQSVLSNRLAQTVPARVPPALLAAGLPADAVDAFLAALAAGGTPAAFADVPGLTPAIEAAGVNAYKLAAAAAYRTVFLSTIAFSGVGIVLSAFAPNVDHLLSHNVNITVEGGRGEATGEEKSAV